MPEIKVGLAPRKVSFYDPLTNTQIALEMPVKTISYDVNTDLTKITHALCCQPPALVLYEGNIPQSFIDAWKAKFDGHFSGKQKDRKGLDGSWSKHTPVLAKDRANAVNAKSADIVTASIEQGDLFSAAANDEAAKAAEEAAKADKAENLTKEAEIASKVEEAVKVAEEDVKLEAGRSGKGK